jgi:hypothetical protein
MGKQSKKSLRSKKPKLVDFYILGNDSEDITLEVAIASPGNSAVTNALVELDPVIVDEPGSIDERPIGTNNSLDGKLLNLTTVVTRLAEGAGFADVGITITGGINSKTYPMSALLAEDGKSAILTITIAFVKL